MLMSHGLGEGASAAARLKDGLAAATTTSATGEPRMRGAGGFLHLANGDLPRLKEVAERACADTAAVGQDLTNAWAHYFLGRVHYEWNELADAEAHFAAVCAVRHKCHFMLLRNAMHGLALSQQAQGRADAAVHTFAALRAWVAQLRDGDQLAIEQAFEARLALLGGDRALAERWVQASEPLAPIEGVLAVHDPRVTRVQVLLTRGTEAAARQAAAEAAALLAQYEAAHATLRVVELLALQALAHQALGATTVALDALERALRLAEPAGRVRVFVELGPAMGRLLALYAARRGMAPYLERLLAACGTTPAPGTPMPPSRKEVSLQLVEPLTRRELEVLQRLQTRRTNDEIARALYVSVDTVKKHTKNLYQKLQVDGRRHAVAQAIVLGLLPPSPAAEPGDPALAPA
jgi:LuxR family transcriptional regulator, maltose regulon positive regulatory protein